MKTAEEEGTPSTGIATVEPPPQEYTIDDARRDFENLKALRQTMNKVGYQIGARCLEFYRNSAWALLGYEEGEHGFNQALKDIFGRQQAFARYVMKKVEQLPLLLGTDLSKLSSAALNELMRLGDEALDPKWAEMAGSLTEEEFIAEVAKALEAGPPTHIEAMRTFKVGSLPDSLFKVAADSLAGFRRITKEVGLGESNEAAFEYILRAAWESPHVNADGEIDDVQITNERFLETLDSGQAKAVKKFTDKRQKPSLKPRASKRRSEERKRGKKGMTKKEASKWAKDRVKEAKAAKKAPAPGMGDRAE